MTRTERIKADTRALDLDGIALLKALVDALERGGPTRAERGPLLDHAGRVLGATSELLGACEKATGRGGAAEVAAVRGAIQTSASCLEAAFRVGRARWA